jgi:hypothetical protein
VSEKLAGEIRGKRVHHHSLKGRLNMGLCAAEEFGSSDFPWLPWRRDEMGGIFVGCAD